MFILFFSLAIISLVIAHWFKVYRLKQFIEIYEEPHSNNLLQSLSFGYIINFIIPFRLGDLFRAWYSGKKMKNGVSFSLATIVVDRVLDIIMVGVIFLLFYLFGFRNDIVSSSMRFYIIGSGVLLLILILGYVCNKYIKIIIKKVAGIFNDKIELKLLKFSWSLISSLKDMILNLDKLKMLINTICMWALYLLSYALFAYSMRIIGTNISFIDVFILLFSKNSLDISTGQSIATLNPYIISLYLVIPLILLLIYSFLNKEKVVKNKESKYLELLPQINPQDKLVFLENYFSATSEDYFKKYIMLNRDISIIQDFSAGSNATTMLCTDGTNTFYRKYSFGKDSEKLFDQINWLTDQKKDLPLTKLGNIKHGKDYCSYDMPYIKEAIGCFNYVHSTPITKGWKVLKSALDSINDNLHTKNVRNADAETISKYIDSKVNKNIEKIENGQYIKGLLKYDYIYINGKKYHNFKYFKKYLSKDYLMNIFKDDLYSDIHGDFTIENIICLTDKDTFYIIDPNTGNLHDSPNLDFAKLLQSLHGNYEFLMKTFGVEIFENKINYLCTSSSVYDQLYSKYKEYLFNKFDDNRVKSIYYHEIIHWLRLMPYKIEKNKERSVLFYCGMIIVLNDIISIWED